VAALQRVRCAAGERSTCKQGNGKGSEDLIGLSAYGRWRASVILLRLHSQSAATFGHLAHSEARSPTATGAAARATTLPGHSRLHGVSSPWTESSGAGRTAAHEVRSRSWPTRRRCLHPEQSEPERRAEPAPSPHPGQACLRAVRAHPPCPHCRQMQSRAVRCGAVHRPRGAARSVGRCAAAVCRLKLFACEGRRPSPGADVAWQGGHRR